MAINVTKACDGTFYPFTESITFNNDLIDTKLGEFLTPVTITGNYVVDSEANVYIDATMQYQIKFPCDRCLKAVVKSFDIRFTASFYLLGNDSQEGYYSYNNNIVDITEAVAEDVVLSLPNRVLCDTNCKGICPHCGINLNEAQCHCLDGDASEGATVNKPFAALKDLNKFMGGASNGSTKG